MAGREESDPTLWERINPSHGHMFFLPAWQRALVILAGVTMNFLIGILMFSVVYAKLGVPKMSGEQVMVSAVSENSPAELANIQVGEVLVRVGETEIKTWINL